MKQEAGSVELTILLCRVRRAPDDRALEEGWRTFWKFAGGFQRSLKCYRSPVIAKNLT